MAKGKFKCKKCDRSFKMALHLGRHISAMHGSGKKKAAAKKKRAKKRVMKKLGRPRTRKVGRPKKKHGAKKLGRPKGIVGRLKLRDMSIDQLAQVIDAARDEARRRLAELQASIG